MTTIVSVGTALGTHEHTQEDITAEFSKHVVGDDQRAQLLLKRIHEATTVRTRHLALPLADYDGLNGFDDANEAYVRVGMELAQGALEAAITGSAFSARDIDLVVSVSVTGVAVPSLDARLVQQCGLRPDVKRLPVFGLGCVAGAAGIARVHDYLVGHPDDVAVLLSVELCSLTVQRGDPSLANMVGSGLFGDGAAAVVMVGERRAQELGVPGPTVVATRSRMYPDTERVMGWDIGGSGFRIVLAPTVADVVEANLGEDVEKFLADQGLAIGDVRHWVAHPGGPKVLEAVASALGLERAALEVTWRSLAAVGNLSSASVLHVLDDTLAEHPAGTKEAALLFAMGPGFCAEFVLLEW